MADGHGPVSGLLEAVYTGDVEASKEGFLRYQLLKLGGGSDSEGPNEVDSDEDWGADPVAAFEASKRHEVKPSHRRWKKPVLEKAGRSPSGFLVPLNRTENRCPSLFMPPSLNSRPSRRRGPPSRKGDILW